MRHEFDDRHHFYEFSAVEYYTCLFNEQTNYKVKPHCLCEQPLHNQLQQLGLINHC